MKTFTAPRQFERHFHAMGTEVGLWVWNANEQRAQNALGGAQRFFAQTEARLSRFRPQSELSRLNRSAGQPFEASRLLFDLVANALAWRERTQGIFDPTILTSLLEAGYDRSFDIMPDTNGMEDIVVAQTERSAALTSSRRQSRAHEIEMGPGTRIRLPEGVGIDLGGIAKGWAAQQAAQRLGVWGGSLVDAGGDIATVGTPPGEPWVVKVADPRDATRDVAVLALNGNAVATSSRARRRWLHQGRPAHHLIDPRTGEPAATRLLSVTVVAPALPEAEIHAKTALILGEDEGRAYLDALKTIPALLVCEGGREIPCGSFEDLGYGEFSDFSRRFQHAA